MVRLGDVSILTSLTVALTNTILLPSQGRRSHVNAVVEEQKVQVGDQVEDLEAELELIGPIGRDECIAPVSHLVAHLRKVWSERQVPGFPILPSQFLSHTAI